ncbi:MAG TPA: hypothetical protein VGH80_03055 [Xanthomonadaceae bacterium]|jgi:hypothetical protein
MNFRSVAVGLLAFALAGCATTDPGDRGGDHAVAYAGGYYVAPQDGRGDYYYGQPRIEYADDPWYGGGYASFGFGFSPWGFGYGPWFGPPPWWGWHHHGWHHPWVAGPPGSHGPVAPGPHPHPAPIRAPHHGFQH